MPKTSKSLVGWFSVIAIAVGLLMPLYSGVNPLSRIAAMAAMCRTGSFEISEYVAAGWTVDWARLPDGKTYSNKAPGAILLGTPFFCILDRLSNGTDSTLEMQYRLRYLFSAFLSLIFQLLPLAAGVLRATTHLRALNVPESGLRFFALAVLFGNTSSLFMNTWFAHGAVAVCALWAWIFMYERAFIFAGLALGLAVSFDYSSALIALAFLIACECRAWTRFIVGSALPIAATAVYHWKCFGNPFTLPQRFQNPIFVDASRQALYGIFSAAPTLESLGGLIWGLERGLLWTQPWVFLAIGAGFKVYRTSLITRQTALYALASFGMLFWMNASFGQWHAGATPGPRYLSGGLALLALPISLYWRQGSLVFKRISWLALAPAVALYVLVYSTTPLAPEGRPLWPELFAMAQESPGQAWIRLFVFILSAVLLAFAARTRRVDSPKVHPH